MHTLCWRARYAGSTAQAEGLDFKQSVADAIAGEYDREAITAEVQAAASASPLVRCCVDVYAMPQPWAQPVSWLGLGLGLGYAIAQPRA